jgi:3-mercaptopyruvate sulfurtransferase SseA
MKRPVLVVLTLILAVVVVGGSASKRQSGDRVVAKVGQFRKSNGRLPNALSDIGTKEDESCPCYCKTGADSYVVWYGTTLGESDAYDSRTKEWSEAAGAVCSP